MTASEKWVDDQDGPAAPLTWYFDLVSPFAYLALSGVERLAARHPVRFRPVVLGAILSHWGGLGPAEIPPKRLHTYRLCQFLADRAGVPFRFPPAHPFRSLDAMHGLAAAEEPEARAVRAAFEHIWARGGDPAALPLVAARGCPVILMHMRGTPQTMGGLARYGDVTAEVLAELSARVVAWVPYSGRGFP